MERRSQQLRRRPAGPVAVERLYSPRRLPCPQRKGPNTGLLCAGFERDPVDVAHFPAGARLGLAVEIGAHRRAEARGHGTDLIADEVFHRDAGEPAGVAQRPAADRPDVLFELVGDADGLGPVAGIMDAWRDLVDEELAVGEDEELDAEDADVVERGGDGGCRLDRANGRLAADARGDTARFQDVIAVGVLSRVEGGNAAVEAAGDDDGDFLVERDESLEHERFWFESGEGLSGLPAFSDRALALAVVAEASGLEDG